MLMAAGMVLPMLAGCGAAIQKITSLKINNNSISVPIDLFEKNKLQIIRPEKWEYEIAVLQKQDGTYSALLLKCTHFENQLSAESNGFSCSAHGSRFNSEGTVIKGPAEEPLKKYKTSINNNELIISI